MFLPEAICGLSWTSKQREIIEAVTPFNFDVCKIEFEFVFDKDGNECFIRKANNALYAEFGMLNIPTKTFQIYNVSMNFDSVDYNWFAGGQSRPVSYIC